MKIDYFYGEIIRTLIKHLIRTFGEFQVIDDYDALGNPIYKVIPCRYADISRQVAINQVSNSETVALSAPMMTINITNIKLDRPHAQGDIKKTSIVPLNKNLGTNSYANNELDSIHEVTFMNPVPWVMEFNLNIWTTNLTNKLELWEQITALFNPSIELQVNDNPLDPNSITFIELVNSQFSTRGFPQNINDELDIGILSFKLPFYMSLPAKVNSAKLIQQIVTNVKISNDNDKDVDLNEESIFTDVYTPKNMNLKVKNNSSVNSFDLTLLMPNNNTETPDGKRLSWQRYLNKIEPNYKDKDITIRLMKSIEDPSPIKLSLKEFLLNDKVNTIRTELLLDSIKVDYVIKDLITSNNIKTITVNNYYINYDKNDIVIKNTNIPLDCIFKIDENGNVSEIIPPNDNFIVKLGVEYEYYRFSTEHGWIYLIEDIYERGFWRIGIKG